MPLQRINRRKKERDDFFLNLLTYQMTLKMHILSLPIAGLFFMHGWSYLANPTEHLRDQRTTWILV